MLKFSKSLGQQVLSLPQVDQKLQNEQIETWFQDQMLVKSMHPLVSQFLINVSIHMRCYEILCKAKGLSWEEHLI